MTGTPEQRGPSSPAMQIDDQAAEWFDKRHFWSWNDADEEQLNAWLAMSPAHEIAYWRLEAGWERGERMAALAPTFREEPKRAAKRPPLRTLRRCGGRPVHRWLSGLLSDRRQFRIGATAGEDIFDGGGRTPDCGAPRRLQSSSSTRTPCFASAWMRAKGTQPLRRVKPTSKSNTTQ